MTIRPEHIRPKENDHQQICVLIVDDSAVIRGVIRRWVESDESLKVIASAANGRDAIALSRRHQPDVVILDIEMPEMDGLSALPLIKEAAPQAAVVMASAMTKRNADISIRALRHGAADYIPKPNTRERAATSDAFRDEVIAKIKALGHQAKSSRIEQSFMQKLLAKQVQQKPKRPSLSGRFRPKLLAIGASTGGPQALFELISNLPGDFKVPTVITQHMPKTFTGIFADHLSRISGREVREAVDGDVLRSGAIFLAPGDQHMTFERVGYQVRVKLDDGPKENFCRPSVDPMLRSAVEIYGKQVLSVVLTGMGHDGLKGVEAVKDAGGCCVAQDAETSVVWGMPGAVVKAGLSDVVLPLKDIAPYVQQIMMGEAA